MERHEEYFKEAAAQFRLKGVGGIQLPNPDLTPNPQDPIKVDPARQVKMKGDWVVVGGNTVRSRQPKSPIQILGVSAKILDQRKADAAKKDTKDNNTDSK